MAQINPNNKNWIDSRGREIPPVHIDPIVKHRDRKVESIFKKAAKLNSQMVKVKAEILNAIHDHMDYVAKKTGAPSTGKGNIKLGDFSGKLRVRFQINDVVEFDERLQSAKAIIDELLKSWAEGTNKNLQAVISRAFDTDKAGKINVQNILRLRTIKIRNKKWNQAMDLISDSITITSTREYLHIQYKDDGIWKTVNLNFSTL